MNIPKPTPDEILSFERGAVLYLKKNPSSNPGKALAKLAKISERLGSRKTEPTKGARTPKPDHEFLYYLTHDRPGKPNK